jgi:HK97 family phage major capsid protein
MSIPTRVVSSLPPGTAFSRYLMAKFAGQRSAMNGIEHARQWRDSPQVLAALEAEIHYIKSAVAPGTTTDATYAAPLAQYGIAAEVLSLLRGATILGALEGKLRRVPFHIRVPRETSAPNGAWVAEGAPAPVGLGAFDTLSQEQYKSSAIVAVTRELLTAGGPGAEKALRDAVVGGAGAFLDLQFLTSTITAVANTRPAAITNGATAITSTGTTAAQMSADLNAMIAAISSPGAALVWIMKPTTFARIAGTLASGVGPGSLFGLPVVASANSPQQVTLIDAASILFSDDGDFDVDLSTSATLQMNSAPDSPATAATVATSMFQNNMVAIRAMRWLAYTRAHTGAVSYMTTAY